MEVAAQLGGLDLLKAAGVDGLVILEGEVIIFAVEVGHPQEQSGADDPMKGRKRVCGGGPRDGVGQAMVLEKCKHIFAQRGLFE